MECKTPRLRPSVRDFSSHTLLRGFGQVYDSNRPKIRYG
jgi:hypothetical protein